MENYCIIVNKDRDEGLELTKKVQEYLHEHGKQFCMRTESIEEDNEFEELPDDVECAIVLGGDGTMIRAANRLLHYDISMFGINTGALGYLTCVEAPEAEHGLERLCNKEYYTENRMMLDVFYRGEYCDTVLNEVAINRSGVSRLISLAVYVNGVLLDVVSGDGLLISTPTGSTGYNMSAGGAIVKPETQLMMITPLCPHSLSSRGIIVSAEDEITVEVVQNKRVSDVEVIATLDGREAVGLKGGEKIVIRKSDYTTKLIKMDNRNFFEVLRSKLGSVER